MHLLAGCYVLTSVPRTIPVIVRAASDETDTSVVWFNPKNSNRPCAERTPLGARAGRPQHSRNSIGIPLTAATADGVNR